ncbi:MAG TPA: hypothetical protein PKU77_13910 [Ferruginibacter sp.]|nr:hypothetical protein [Ferruginibacter sp.]
MTNILYIEVLKTDLQNTAQAEFVISRLLQQQPAWKINTDLEDCDNILRIASHFEIDVAWVCTFLEGLGCRAEIL